MAKLRFLSATKNIDLSNYPDEAWTFLSGEPDTRTVSIQTLHKFIPVLSRAVSIRANSVSSMAFAIYNRAGAEVDTSAAYTNAVKVMPNPRKLLWLFESSLALAGRAYAVKMANGKAAVLKYIPPTGVTPEIDYNTDTLVNFIKANGDKKAVEDILYIWPPDPYKSIGATDASAAQAAAQSAGVLYNMDLFLSAYFERGAVRPTIISVSGSPSKEERDRLRNWWNDAMSGIRNAFRNGVFNADAIKAETIGDGLEALQNTALNEDQRNDVALAMGIPMSLLFSNAANYATSRQDEVNYYTTTIMPECNLIAEALNEQVFLPMGYRFAFRPEAMDVFKRDEAEAASAYATYVGAGMAGSIAAQLVGIELPDGVEYADLDTMGEPEPMGDTMGEPEKSALADDLARWRRKAQKSLDNGKGASVQFVSENIPDELHLQIAARLADAKTHADIDRAFQPDDTSEMVKLMRDAVRILRDE